jgi:hypothetical protein
MKGNTWWIALLGIALIKVMSNHTGANALVMGMG